MEQDPKPSAPYFGPERREGSDRREEFRFEPTRPGRRNGKDRRKQQGWDGTLIR